MVEGVTRSNKLYLRRVSLQVVSLAAIKDFEGLRITFEVEKSNEGKPAPANISIYNLSDKSRALFEGVGTRVILSAGYESNFGVIFSGNIVRAKQKKKKSIVKETTQHRYEEVDIITEIEAADGHNKYRTSYTARAFPPGTKVRDVLSALTTDFGLTANIDLEAIAEDAQYAQGFSACQETRYLLDDICKTYGLEWSIQNEILQIISKDKTTKFGAILLTPKTGLIGSPVKTTNGCEFKSLLQPSIIPGASVKLESKFFNGLYKVQKVTHKGDSHEGDFYSECEATAI